MKKTFEISYMLPCSAGNGGLSVVRITAKTIEKAKEKLLKQLGNPDGIIIIYGTVKEL